MIKFKQFLSEADDVNRHMEHLEDEILNAGVAGAVKSINYLQQFRDMLKGTSKSKLNVSVKWDGAPSIFAGIDPTDGRFFVAKKGIFNTNPKVYKTASEIDAELSGDLADKFKLALLYLPSLGIKGIIQGDFLFSHKDLKTVEIDGEHYITFHPNTIVYAVPSDSKLGSAISSAQIGIVWHTRYEGKSFSTLKAVYNTDIVSSLHKSSNVWVTDAMYRDVSGTVTFTEHEAEVVTSALSAAGTLLRSIKASAVNSIHQNPDLLMVTKTYCNSKIREGKSFTTESIYHGLIKFIQDRAEKEAAKLKTIASRDRVFRKRDEMLRTVMNIGVEQWWLITKFMHHITEAKLYIIAKLNTMKQLHMFLKTANGYEVTGYEGFVAADHGKGAVKFVDRLTFSKANFDPMYQKGWER